MTWRSLTSVTILGGVLASSLTFGANLKEEVVRKYLEIWKGNPAIVDEVLAPDFVRLGPTADTSVTGIEEFKQYVDKVRKAYPDFTISFDKLSVQDHQVVTQWTAKGTNTGQGVRPPTGKSVEISGTSLYRVANGKVVQERASWDVLGLYLQLGVDPPLEQRDQNLATVRRVMKESEQPMQVQYLEIVTKDVDAVCATYAKLHGVTFSEPNAGLGGARTAVLAAGGMIGVRAPMHEAEEQVVRPYLLVDDIEAAAKAAVESGGEIAHPPMKLPDGTFAIFIQGGIHHGLWQR